MPIYEYRCPDGHTFEVFQRMADPPSEVCEVCGKAPVEKVLYPVAVHYKGSGFYSTDYGKGGRKAAATKDGDRGSSSSQQRLGPEQGLRLERDGLVDHILRELEQAGAGRRLAPLGGPVADDTAGRERLSGRRRLRRRGAAEHRDRGEVLLIAEDHRLAADRGELAAEPAVQRP